MSVNNRLPARLLNGQPSRSAPNPQTAEASDLEAYPPHLLQMIEEVLEEDSPDQGLRAQRDRAQHDVGEEPSSGELPRLESELFARDRQAAIRWQAFCDLSRRERIEALNVYDRVVTQRAEHTEHSRLLIGIPPALVAEYRLVHEIPRAQSSRPPTSGFSR